MTFKLTRSFRYLLFALFVATCSYAYGEEQTSKLKNEYSVKRLTADDGFVSSEIYSIIQDQQGLLWFGTAENGVMRYDGRKVTLFEFDSLNPNGLSHNDAGNLMLDRQGNIWIGTWGGGANFYDPEVGKFENFLHDPLRADSISANRIQSLFHDSEGNVWFGSYDKGLNRYLGNNKFQRITKIEGKDNSLSHNRIWDIEDNDKSSLWVATSFGLNLFNKKDLTFRHFFPDPTNKTATGANEIRSILKSSTGTLFVATQEGPFIFHPNTQTFERQTTASGENLGQVNSMLEDHSGDMWFVSTKGIYRKRFNEKQLEKLEFEHNNGLRIIFEDHTKTKWVTSEIHGIFKLVPHRQIKSISGTELNAPNGITADENGDLLIVSSRSEISKWHVADQRLEKLTDPLFSKENGFSENGIVERPIILLGEGGVLWVAQDESLAKFNINTGELVPIIHPTNKEGFKKFREFRTLCLDDDGNLWVGTYKNGVFVYNDKLKSFTHLNSKEGLSHPEVLEIIKEKNGDIWVGTGDGVNIWNKSAQRFNSLKSDPYKEDSLLGTIVQDIHQAKNGDIWVATQKGLNLYLKESQTFKHYSEEDGLPTSLIRAVADDENGALWLTTNKGISMLELTTGKISNYDSDTELIGSNFYANSLVEGANHILFTSSKRGIEFFDYQAVEPEVIQSNLVLTGFSKMGQEVRLDRPYSYVSDIHLTYLDYFFSFEFSVLDFVAPSKNIYAYKLEGYDDNWIDIGNRNTASFTNLDGGSYRFVVRATNTGGEWGENQLAINLHVSPPPWKTWWAYTSYGVMLFLLILFTIFIRTRLQQTEIKRQKNFVLQLEHQVSEKTASLEAQARDLTVALQKAEEATKLKSEFLANMSHEIRTPMNGVIGMLDLLKTSELNTEQSQRLDIASNSASSLLSLINDILDFSKIEADKLELELLDFDLRELIEKLVQTIALDAQKKGLEVVLDVTGLEVSKVKSDPGRIQQILTNILSNAIKFTENGEIKVTAFLAPNDEIGMYTLHCTVEDTGIGVPQNKINDMFEVFNQVDASTTRKYGGTGLGLSITKKLCRLLGGDISVESELGQGSSFEITCVVSNTADDNTTVLDEKYQNINCLIIDDNESNLAALKKQLLHWHVNVRIASSADDAIAQHTAELALPNDECFDLLLLDKHMPGMSGEEIVSIVRKNKTMQQTAIVMMTQLDDLCDSQRSKALEINASIPKPITTKDLMAILRLTIEGGTFEQDKSGIYKGSDTAQGAAEGESNEEPWPKHSHVLLVEDNRVNQVVALNVLKNIGLTADVANNGEEAIQLLNQSTEETKYSIVIMDCQMPVMDGYEATFKIRKGAAGQDNLDIPIVAMTANAMQGDKEKCLDAGMDDYLTKPIEPENVSKVLKKWLLKAVH